MKELKFFDALALIGDTMMGPGPDVAELLAEMDRYGVDKALIGHANLDNLPCAENNRLVAEMVRAGGGRLAGVWGLLPPQCDELPEPEFFFEQMKQSGVVALTISPQAHHYLISKLTLGMWMREAASRGIPIILDRLSPRELYDFLELFPDVTTLIQWQFQKWGSDRQLRPLLEAYRNCYFLLAGYWVPEGIRDLAEKYGAERLLYSSGFPGKNHGSSMLQLRHSGLPMEAIRGIAGENLERILKGVR